MGRSFLFSLNYGKEGVEHLIESKYTDYLDGSANVNGTAVMRDEVETTMKMIGATSIDDLHPGLLSTLDVDHLVPTTEGHPYAKGRPRARAAKL